MNKYGMKKGLRRTVLVTGSTGGIGREIAVRFANGGWNVICHYVSSNKEALDLKTVIKSFEVDCMTIRADLSTRKGINGLMSFIKKHTVDSIINNAASPIVNRHFSSLTIDEIEKSFMINAFSPMILSSCIFMRMKAGRFGRIVNISSIAAKYGGSVCSMHYGSSKRALEGLTKTLARDGARSNVLVNTIRPGVIDTDFYKKFPKNMKRRIEMIPMKRMGLPRDIAEMAFYLGSERNGYITNQTITIAGGE